MNTNEKLSTQVIADLEQENKRLRKLNNHMLALLETALDRTWQSIQKGKGQWLITSTHRGRGKQIAGQVVLQSAGRVTNLIA